MTDINNVNFDEATRAVREHQARTLALEAVLNHAPELGIEAALSRFGSALTDTEKEVLKTLTSDELASLKSILSKLGSQLLFRGELFIF